MCNNTSRDPVKVQQSADASSDSEEFNSEKIADVPMDEQLNEQMNNSNNSNASLSQLNNSAADQQQIDGLSNGITDSYGASTASRLLQTMNLLLSSQLSVDGPDEMPVAANGELIEALQRLLAQGGNQSIANSLLAAAASQRTNSFACKFCAYTTNKRQQLIRHVRTNCEGLLSLMATGATSCTTGGSTTNTKSTTTTNSTNTDCSSPTNESQTTNEEAAGQLLSPSVIAALNPEASGCGNLACVNSNCTNGNSCVLLSNAGGASNDKLKSIGPAADDSEEDYTNSANPQDRYCTECEIQFVSYKNYRVSHRFC